MILIFPVSKLIDLVEQYNDFVTLASRLTDVAKQYNDFAIFHI